MLSKEAIQHIEAQAVAAAASRVVTEAAELAVLGQEYRLENLEQYQHHRNRFRGALTTHSPKDFTAYVAALLPDGNTARGFVDQDAMSARVVFNLGTDEHPGHGDHTATLILKQTAAFKALQEVVGRQLNQQQLAEWLEDWLQNLQASANGADLPMLQAIAGIRRMTLKATAQRDSTVSDFGASRSAMDEIEAKSQETLASSFTFTTVPYEGLQPAAVQLRLSVITGKDEPVLKLRWVGEEAQREEFAREFKELLTAEVGGLVPMTIGTFQLGK